MADRQKYFEAQQDGEQVKLLFRKHWFTLTPGMFVVVTLYLIGFFLLFLPIFISGVIEGSVYNLYVLALSLLFLIATNILFSVVLLYYLNVGIVTDRHIVEIIQQRFFARKVSQIELGRIQDVTSSQMGVWQTMLNFGQIDIQTAGETPNVFFKKVPRPQELTENIITLVGNYAGKSAPRTELGEPKKLDGEAEKKPE
jgi:uncharacterized membrane protein YdbT with pleckstrin-like domain